MTPVVIGIDAQTRVIAAACANGGVVTTWSIERETSRGVRVESYAAKLVTLMRRAQELGAVVYLEDTYLETSRSERRECRNVHTLKRLSEVQGEIKHEADRHRVPLETVSANEWRAAVLGRVVGREELKAMAKARAARDTGRADLTEHEADAVCVCQYGVLDQKGT